MGPEENAALIDGRPQWLYGRHTEFHLLGWLETHTKNQDLTPDN